MDDAPQFVELAERDLPEWLPRPESPPGIDVAWFRGPSSVDEWDSGHELGVELYVWRAGNGGAPPFRVMVFTTYRRWDQPAEVPGVAVWPRLEDVWAALDATCLVGAMFQLPAHIVGPEYVPKLEGQAVTVVQAAQVGAIAGSPAFFRWSLSTKAVGLVQ